MRLWTPAQISTALWLDASDSSTLFDATSGGSLPGDGVGVGRWEDKSGNGRHATQATSGNRPTRRTSQQNSLDICRFVRGNSQSLDLSTTAANILQNKSYGSIFAVAKWNGAGGADQTIVCVSRNGNSTQLRLGLQLTTGSGLEFRAGARRLDLDSFTGAPTGNNSSWGLLESRCNYSGGSLSLRVNATQLASANLPSTGNTSNTASDSVSLGLIGVSFLDADLAEIIILDVMPSAETNQYIEGYLAHKWGLQSSLPNDHPYKNFATGVSSNPIDSNGGYSRMLGGYRG